MKNSGFRGFLRRNGGNVAIIFAMMLVPIAWVISLAIDSSRQVSTKRHIAFAADAASLAGARAMEDGTLTDNEIKGLVKKFYLAQLDTAFGDLVCDEADVAVDRTARTVQVGGSCDVPTIFPVLTTDNVPVRSDAMAQAKITQLELALVLDVSTSMSASQIAELKAAAKDFVASVLTPATADRVRISAVPFAYSVNAGIYGNRALGRADLDDRAGDGTDKVCVSQRQHVQHYYTDAEPISGQRVDDGSAYGQVIVDLCPDDSVMPLTNEAATINSLIDGLPSGTGYTPEETAALGGTAGHVALSWGWYSLSPNWNSVWPTDARPADYSDQTTKKVIILLSDGQNNELYSGQPFHPWHAQLKASAMCTGIHDDSTIQIYVINYLPVGTPPFTHYMGMAIPPEWAALDPVTLLRHCASSDDHYFQVSPSMDYAAIFGRIATSLQETRIVG